MEDKNQNTMIYVTFFLFLLVWKILCTIGHYWFTSKHLTRHVETYTPIIQIITFLIRPTPSLHLSTPPYHKHSLYLNILSPPHEYYCIQWLKYEHSKQNTLEDKIHNIVNKQSKQNTNLNEGGGRLISMIEWSDKNALYGEREWMSSACVWHVERCISESIRKCENNFNYMVEKD